MASPERGYTLRVKITPFGSTVDANPDVLTPDYNSVLGGLLGLTGDARQRTVIFTETQFLLDAKKTTWTETW